jgi:ABC-type nitrate/sulfonate/bicarbonate transport system ATPase subunit
VRTPHKPAKISAASNAGIGELDQLNTGSVRAGSERNGYAHIGYAFQEPELLPWRNILRNVALPWSSWAQRARSL